MRLCRRGVLLFKLLYMRCSLDLVSLSAKRIAVFAKSRDGPLHTVAVRATSEGRVLW